MKDKLPGSFAIKHDSNNPLWAKYIDWLNETYEWNFEGNDSDYYYGFYFTPIVYSQQDLPTAATILTLDQWHKSAYPKYEVSYVAEQPSDNDEVLRLAIKTYGGDKQAQMCIEEMAELTQAICKWKRNGFVVTDNLIEEIADVEIMIKQMRIQFDLNGAIDRVKFTKIARLNDRIQNEINPTTHD